ncbi:MAG TPA: hydroxymethylbilane synthase [Acidimicrobiia bacterium]|jgi:hydroxymethylbilane synthase
MLRIATRGSQLARWQARRVATLLGGDAELVIVSTSGDRRADTPIHAMGGTGVFVKEVQEAVLDGRADVAQHSAKDLPAQTPDGLVLAAVPERADARDALVGSTFDALPEGARVATGSVRRRAQLAAARPDLVFAELRGNVDTRLAKAADHDAIVLAAAGLDRLGLADRISERLDLSLLLPMVGQGALAVECRADDEGTLERLRAIDDADVHAAVRAERAFLAELGGGCSLPCAAHATVDGDLVVIDALLASHDGRVVVRAGSSSRDAGAAGTDAARQVLADGGRELIAS